MENKLKLFNEKQIRASGFFLFAYPGDGSEADGCPAFAARLCSSPSAARAPLCIMCKPPRGFRSSRQGGLYHAADAIKVLGLLM